MLESCLKFAATVLAQPIRDGVHQRGTTLCARRGPGLIAIDEPYAWALALRDLLSDEGFINALMSPGANIAAMGRAVIHVRLDAERPRLLRYGCTVRKATELAALKLKKHVAVETADSVKLAPAYGRMGGRRPGRSRAGMEANHAA